MAALELWDYQTAAIDQLRTALKQGHKRPILCAPTGSGKTEMAIHLIQEAARKGSKVAFVADRRSLVKQTSRRLTDYGVWHGVAMGSDTVGRFEPIQVCSAQTIEKRQYWPELDLLIIDECHTVRNGVVRFTKQWGGPVIGLSATPLTDGLGKHYDAVVNATTTNALLEQGYLAPLKVYACAEIDMTGAAVTAGEWQANEVRERGRQIIGDIVSEWVRLTHKHFGGPVKTLAFSADVQHGADLCDAFQKAGYDFRQSTYRDNDTETDAMVAAFKASEFIGLVSVEKFVKGFDVPDVLCLIGARPYKSSLAALIQQMGRGMRRADGKEYCLYLDHGGNMEGWYEAVTDVWQHGVSALPDESKPKPIRKERGQHSPIACSECGYVPERPTPACLNCGAARKRITETIIKPGQMREMDKAADGQFGGQSHRWVWQQVCAIARERKGGDEYLMGRFAKAQFYDLVGSWPPRYWGIECASEIDPRVERLVEKKVRAYIRQKKEEARGANE